MEGGTGRNIFLFLRIDHFIRVSESGIKDPINVIKLKKYGFNGFLMGEHFMQSANPHLKCAEFIKSLKKLEEVQ